MIVEQFLSESKKRKQKLDRWTNINGVHACPNCQTIAVTHLTVAGEGEKLICQKCDTSEIVGLENFNLRRGLKRERNFA